MENKYLIIFRSHHLDTLCVQNLFHVYKQILKLRSHDFLFLYDDTRNFFDLEKLKTISSNLFFDKENQHEMKCLLFNKDTIMFKRKNYDFWKRGDIPITWASLILPEYDYYYQIDYDCYSNNWRQFFLDLSINNSDMLATHIQKYAEHPNWYWWPDQNLDQFKSALNPELKQLTIEREQLLKSFFPIIRLSKAALDSLKKYYNFNFKGHCEVFTPSVINSQNLSVQNISRDITKAKILHKKDLLF
jgi:hypothetical protein